MVSPFPLEIMVKGTIPVKVVPTADSTPSTTSVLQAQSTIRATPLDLQTMLAMSTIAFVVLTTSLLPSQSVIRAIMLGPLPTLAMSTKGSILSTTSVLLMQSTIKAITMGLLPMLSNGLYLVDSISPSNAFHDQGNLSGLAPYDGMVDHGL